MGAKQSKRSVDISGKEAEGAGEVAAAGAGGEGRMEQLGDADALKPQLNGDAHIHEQTEKEKQLDSGTPENEKDATTEKETKQEESGKEEKEATPVTNGENGESKPENGESTPTSEDAKKPKKEKVKKKWSLRSISFSRKEKPKQEKKQKEEEPKTNGEPEKVPEEAAEATAESANNESPEVKTEEGNKDEKTPETPVTEPITNGSNTPESPKEEIAPVEKEVPASPEEKPEPKPAPEPEQLPVNGLSLEEPKSEAPQVAQTEESKPEEPAAEPTESVPAIDIPVQKEVCVERMPLMIESTPPPLPANPPPSSVASFAATTMAPELTDASLANTAETATPPPPALLDTKTNAPDESLADPPAALTTADTVTDTEVTLQKSSQEIPTEIVSNNENPASAVTVSEIESDLKMKNVDAPQSTTQKPVADKAQVDGDVDEAVSEAIELPSAAEPLDLPTPEQESVSEPTEDFPPPPPADEEFQEKTEIVIEDVRPVEDGPPADDTIPNSNYTNGDVTENLNGIDEIAINAKNKAKDAIGNVVERVECNGNLEGVESKLETTEQETCEEESLPLPPSPVPASESADAAPDAVLPAPDAAPPAPAALQEPLPVSDKIADLIPEVPVVPELKTETESSELAVATN